MRSSPKNSPNPALPARSQRAIALLMLLVLFAGLVVHHVMAADNGKTIMLGESLTDDQKQELLDYFDAKGEDRVEVVTIADTQAAMTGIIEKVPNSAYSSTALTCRELG